jgi:hypothetical protein
MDMYRPLKMPIHALPDLHVGTMVLPSQAQSPLPLWLEKSFVAVTAGNTAALYDLLNLLKPSGNFTYHQV